MCFSCFTGKRKNSANQSHQQSPRIQLRDRANRSTHSNTRPSTRRGDHQGALASHAERQPTVTAVPPDREQDTDRAISSAFTGPPPPRPLRRQSSRKVSRMPPPTIQESAAEPNVTTYPEETAKPSPLRGDLRTLPSVRGQRPSERCENERVDPPQLAVSSRMSWSTSSGEGEQATPPPRATASSSGGQGAPVSHFSDSSSSAEEAADTATLRPASAVTQVERRTGSGGTGASFRSSSSSD